MNRIIVFLLLTLILPACAQNISIGMVDFEYIIAESKGGAFARAQSEAFKNAKTEELQPIRESLIKMQEDYKAQERRLTAKEKETMNADFQAKSLAFENTTRAFAAEVQAKNGELSEGVVNEVKEVISIVAKEQNIKLVVDINTVLFSEGAVNLTEAVLIRYNLRYAK